MRRGPFEHLYHRVPNNRLTRYLVRWINNRLAKADSRYRLEIRYRKPKRGHKYDWGGNIQRKLAKRFALYLKLTHEAKRMESEERRRRYQRDHTIELNLMKTIREHEQTIKQHERRIHALQATLGETLTRKVDQQLRGVN